MVSQVDNAHRLWRPPDDPWRPLVPAPEGHAYASYYYCDDFGAWPVRAITKLKDNKSDPNLETGTYGLFSTCEEKMRSGIVQSRPRYMFFVTRPRKGPRQLTGYYELGFYTPGALRARTRDFALAAISIRFIEPIALGALPADLAVVLTGRWRLNKRLGPEDAAALRAVVDARPDRTRDYLAEIDRLERINQYHSGFRYPTWRRPDPFTWNDAERYLREAHLDPDAPTLTNRSPSGWWGCVACERRIENAALLKACPHCHRLDTLRPAVAPNPVEGSR